MRSQSQVKLRLGSKDSRIKKGVKKKKNHVLQIKGKNETKRLISQWTIFLPNEKKKCKIEKELNR